jgi:hypothetical protein
LDEAVQDAFRDVTTRFVNMYAFVSQIVSYVDRQLERDYLYARALLACLPGQEGERLDVGREVELTHLKIAQTYEGSGSLEEGGGEVVAIFSGRGPEHQPEQEHLSRIVDVMTSASALSSATPTSSCSTSSRSRGRRTGSSQPGRGATTSRTSGSCSTAP